MIDTRGAGIDRPLAPLPALARDTVTTLRRPTVRQPTRRQVAAFAERMAGAWAARRAYRPSRSPGPGPDLERRLDALEARMTHLEGALEGLQDALYRQAVREDANRADLRERTAPDRIARELSADARRRGL